MNECEKRRVWILVQLEASLRRIEVVQSIMMQFDKAFDDTIKLCDNIQMKEVHFNQNCL